MARRAALKTVAGRTVEGSTPSPSAKVVNRDNLHEDWEDDPDYVSIMRGTKWGNRWVVGPLSREEAIARYEEDLPLRGLLDDLEELRGKFLVCACAPLPCHGDVLVKWLEIRKSSSQTAASNSST